MPANDDYSDIVIEPSNIENIDTAMFRFIDEKMNLHAKTNEHSKKVPVLFASAERAFLAKKSAEDRDNDGTLELPIISIERGAIDKNIATKSTSYFGPTPFFIDPIHGSYIKINRKIVVDKTNNFAVADNIKDINGVRRTPNGQAYFPKKENKKVVTVSYYLPRPVSITTSYNITIKTTYIQQMNELVQPFMTMGDHAKAVNISNKGHKYEAFLAGTYTAQNNSNSFTDSERVYITVVSFSVLGYLMGEGDNQIRPKIIKRENAVEIKIPRERVLVGDMQQFDPSGGFYRE